MNVLHPVVLDIESKKLKRITLKFLIQMLV